MWIRCTQAASPHSQIRSSGWLPRSKVSASDSIRSLTSRKTASLRPIRSSRLWLTRSSRSRRSHRASRRLPRSTVPPARGPRRSRNDPRAHGSQRTGTRELQDLYAVLHGAFAEERQAFHLGSELVRLALDRLVRLSEPLVVRLDPLGAGIGHACTSTTVGA